MVKSVSMTADRNIYLTLILLKIRVIDRKQEVPHDGPMCDLLWSDPEGNTGKCNKLHIINKWYVLSAIQILKAGESVRGEQDTSSVQM